MAFVRRTLRFGSGLVLGAAVSTAVSVLLAPQSGPELQGAVKDRVDEAQRAGEEAELLEQERLKREYRRAVNDPDALTGKYAQERQAARAAQPTKQAEEERKRREDARKAQEELEKTRQRVQKEQQEADKARSDLAKAQEEADKSRREANRTPGA